ncbi:MAG: hypothetical protein PHV16_02360 [Candidatus Nanoarchaeia archaeon]|nr:hypothetical protein [Candidatus Nanoarchaeia archaeon]
MNKRGFELSINFIVILIISIVLFTFGLYFLFRIISEANTHSGSILFG